jgi:hypothetical protein
MQVAERIPYGKGVNMKKFYIGIFLALILMIAPTGLVFAQESTPITGTVQTVVLETDADTNETVAVVTVLDEATGETQTVTLDIETAASLGLVTTDPATGDSTVNEGSIGTVVEIDPATVIDDGEEETEEEHPVGSALGDFFGDVFGADYDTIMAVHEDGVGFGVIAQALWLTNSIDGDTATFQALIEAKQTGDYSAITLADGSTPDNWGDVVKSLKKGDNLGSIMSGKADASEDEETSETAIHGNGNDGDNGNGKDHGNGKDKDKDNNGNGNGNGNGGGNH